MTFVSEIVLINKNLFSIITIIDKLYQLLSKRFIFREPMYGLPLPPKGEEIVCGEWNI